MNTLSTKGNFIMKELYKIRFLTKLSKIVKNNVHIRVGLAVEVSVKLLQIEGIGTAISMYIFRYTCEYPLGRWLYLELQTAITPSLAKITDQPTTPLLQEGTLPLCF